jgi:hypothetical protein
MKEEGYEKYSSLVEDNYSRKPVRKSYNTYYNCNNFDTIL